jgi:hypothetical protein
MTRSPIHAGAKRAAKNCARSLFLACCLAGSGMVLAADTESLVTVDGGTTESHLKKALEYFASGDYVSAKLEFETVLRLEDLPPNLHQQVEIYAAAAEDYIAGQRLLASGYAVAGFGNYRENSTSAGSGETDDNFLNARIGGRLNYVLSDDYALNGGLDYRFRDYDNADRRNDSDLRWNGAVSRNFDENSLEVGVRGRVSYRGNGDYRNDYGLFGDYQILINADNQITIGAEFRRRRYPQGPLRQRSRNIAELTAGWTRSLLDGKASFSLDANVGREYATQNRPDGNSNFYGLSPSFEFTINEQWGGYAFFWWQNDRYNIERITADSGDQIGGITTRNDDLYELGGGLTWEFGEGWSLNPEILYIEDKSNILSVNYSSTELWLTLRYDF